MGLSLLGLLEEHVKDSLLLLCRVLFHSSSMKTVFGDVNIDWDTLNSGDSL